MEVRENKNVKFRQKCQHYLHKLEFLTQILPKNRISRWPENVFFTQFNINLASTLAVFVTARGINLNQNQNCVRTKFRHDFSRNLETKDDFGKDFDHFEVNFKFIIM